MMQLVHGLSSGLVRQAAEALHHHSIVVSAITEALAATTGRLDTEKCAAFGLMHELSAFLWLSRADLAPVEFASPQALSEAARAATFMSFERAFMEFGQPDFANIDYSTLSILSKAHRQASVQSRSCRNRRTGWKAMQVCSMTLPSKRSSTA